MKLNKLQIDILRGARVRLEEEEYGERSYICFKIDAEVKKREKEELNLWWNRMLFWRKYGIRHKWWVRSTELTSAVSSGIRGRSTLGTWFDLETDRVGIKIAEGTLNNVGLYKQIRLAWLDRAIETGVLK